MTAPADARPAFARETIECAVAALRALYDADPDAWIALLELAVTEWKEPPASVRAGTRRLVEHVEALKERFEGYLREQLEYLDVEDPSEAAKLRANFRTEVSSAIAGSWEEIGNVAASSS